MPMTVDIADPSNNQTVTSTTTVRGSYSGDGGNPFVIKCRMSNDVLNVTRTATATVDTDEQTWQASFVALPTSVGDGEGSYLVLAWAEEPDQMKRRVMANPVTGVEVTADPPLETDPPAELARESDDPVAYRVTGSYRSGFGLADGYVVNAYLTRGGAYISKPGRLHLMRDLRWEYELEVTPERKLASLHVELCRAGDGQENPTVKLVRLVTV